jgi:two-component system OmpR family response regulator
VVHTAIPDLCRRTKLSATASEDTNLTAVVIDDDPEVQKLLIAVLNSAGFETFGADNGLDGVNLVLERQPFLVTLDVNMPGIDGFETARRIREGSNAFIMMISALDAESDAVLGLTAGADEFLTKPFRPRELRARIDAILRRTLTMPRPAIAQSVAPDPGIQTVFHHHDLTLDTESRVVRIGESELDLTRTEFELLATLMESKRRVRSKTDLTLVLRGESYVTNYHVSEADRRVIEAHMTNLRRKLGDNPITPRYVETVRGVGYRLTS